MSKYVEFTLPEFLRRFPEFAGDIIRTGLDISDMDYIVRLSPSGLEIGYRSDDWFINKEPKTAKRPPEAGGVVQFH